ncbi:MAG: hypothetical protein SFX73_24455 [Kofleriaceae bacterium]|nr:hypothetical protein [Kofleriaceae bacterium]
MRSAAGLTLLLVLAGCPSTEDGECMQDSDCDSGNVCARDHWCSAPSTVRELTVTWTVNGAPASMAACSAHPDLFIAYHAGYGDQLGFAPVPCHIGQFHIDKLPRRYEVVELGEDGGRSSTKAITGATVAFDLR